MGLFTRKKQIDNEVLQQQPELAFSSLSEFLDYKECQKAERRRKTNARDICWITERDKDIYNKTIPIGSDTEGIEWRVNNQPDITSDFYSLYGFVSKTWRFSISTTADYKTIGLWDLEHNGPPIKESKINQAAAESMMKKAAHIRRREYASKG